MPFDATNGGFPQDIGSSTMTKEDIEGMMGHGVGVGRGIDMPDAPGWARGSILVEALSIINGERQDQYGSPEDSFRLIAAYWSTYLGRDISEKDVALMMVLFKIAREANQHKRDNICDAAGYLGIYGDLPFKGGTK